jgi:hypothetical protein
MLWKVVKVVKINHRLCPMFNAKHTSKEMSVQNTLLTKIEYFYCYSEKFIKKNPTSKKKKTY